MVGVPRSKGCSLCVRRRVKCDQAVPACANCIKYGAECPGYDKSLKFVTGKHAVRPRVKDRAQRRAPGDHETLVDLSSTSTPASDGGSPGAPVRGAGRRSQSRSLDRDLVRPSIPAALRQDCVPLVYHMMGQLFTLHARDDVVISAPWFTCMLDHLGRAPVLDAAMSAFMLQIVGRNKRDAALTSRSHDLYGQSLGALQKALNHPVAWKAAETLGATILCCLYELFAGTQDPLTWMLHVTGVSKLIQQRGSASFSTPFEKALLTGVRPLIVTKAIFAGHDCFLDQPRWRALSSTLTIDQVETGLPGALGASGARSIKWAQYHDEYFTLMAQTAGIVRESFELREARGRGLEADFARLPQLEREATRLREEFLSWYDKASAAGAFSLPVEVPSRDPNSPFSSVLRYNSPWEGSAIISFWATMLILQECVNLCQLGTARPFTDSNYDLGRNILRSLEHVGEGLMGPYRVSYAIRVAYDFVDRPLQLWTLSMVSKYNETYAALSHDVYPEAPVFKGSDGDDEAAEETVVTHSISWMD